MALVGDSFLFPLPSVPFGVSFLRSCDALHDWSITGGQQAQALSLYPGSCQLLVWQVAHKAILLCHLPLPSVSGDKVWQNPGSWEVKEILVAASSSLSGSRGILGQAAP